MYNQTLSYATLYNEHYVTNKYCYHMHLSHLKANGALDIFLELIPNPKWIGQMPSICPIHLIQIVN